MASALAPVVAATLGLVWGSFVGVLVDRVPRGEDVLRGRSRCDACGRTLGVADLIPVVSWVSSGGRCRTCGARVSARCTVVELLAASGAMLGWSRADGSLAAAVLLGAFLGLLVGLALIDLEHGRLPNAIVYPAAAVAACAIAATAISGGPLSLLTALAGAALYGGSLLCIALVSRGGMGMGDVKLAGFIGLVLGAVDLGSVGVAAAAAVLLGGVAGIVALLRGAERRSAIAFGPMLALGAAIGVAFGRELAAAYVGLFA